MSIKDGTNPPVYASKKQTDTEELDGSVVGKGLIQHVSAVTVHAVLTKSDHPLGWTVNALIPDPEGGPDTEYFLGEALASKGEPIMLNDLRLPERSKTKITTTNTATSNPVAQLLYSISVDR